MDPEAVAARLRADEVVPGAVRPRYEACGFAAVQSRAAATLGVDPDRLDLGEPVSSDAVVDAPDVGRVVVLVVDGFGWSQWRRDAEDHPILRRFSDGGIVAVLTSTYPSETAACMTTFHTGRPPAQHGLIGWDVYMSDLDRVVQPLPFRTADGESLEKLAAEAPDAELLFEGESLYPALEAAGVSTTVVQPEATVDSPYSNRVLEAADVEAYETARQLAVGIRRALEAGSSPRYVHAYYPEVDAAAHRSGTTSAAHRRALSALTSALEDELATVDPAIGAETLVLLTADHGAVDTDPATNVDLFAIDGVGDRLRRRPDGRPVPPVGGPRNVHLHAQPDEIDALAADLDAALDAHVFRMGEALEAGLFGDPSPSPLFERRAGDLLVVPRTGSVWHGADRRKLDFVGMHGGLDPREVLVPLASARLPAITS